MREDREDKEPNLRMLFVREGEYEMAVELRPGLRIRYNDESHNMRVSVPTYADQYDHYDFKVDPEFIEPRDADMSVVEKIALRFKEAARRSTDVDLRFCSGEDRLRRPEHDNLRPEYGMKKKVGMTL